MCRRPLGTLRLVTFLMAFLNPILASVALACVALPILIHILLRRRRRPIEWGAMKFLLEAYRQQRKRLKFEQWLLLASRCLLVALLALAVGKPVLGASGLLGQRGPRTLFLLIDNSLSSTAKDTRGELALDRHKAKAAALIAELASSRGDRVGVVALGAPAEAILLPPTPDLASAGSLIRDLRASDGTADIPGALALVRDHLSLNGETGTSDHVVLLSEFRMGTSDVRTPIAGQAALPEHVRIAASRPADSNADNVSIVGMRVLQGVVFGGTGESSVAVRVDLRRSGAHVTGPGVTTLTLSAWAPGAGDVGRAQPIAVRWGAGEETRSATGSIALSRRVGGSVLRAAIDRDAIENDNTLERPIEVRERLNVALVASPSATPATTIDGFTPGDWLRLALNPADDGTLGTRRAGDVSITQLDPARELGAPGVSPLAGMDAVFVTQPDRIDEAGWRRVRAALDAGVLVVLFPPAGEGASVWSDAAARTLGLDWTFAREATTFAEPIRIDPRRSGAPERDLLAQIGGELEELARPTGVTRVLQAEAAAGSMDPILTLANGTPLVMLGQPGTPGHNSGATDEPRSSPSRGVIVYFAAPLDLAWTDLPARPFMVPLIQEILRQGVGRAAGTRQIVAGGTANLTGASELAPISSGAAGAGEAAIPVDADGRPASPLRHAGVYRIRGAQGVSEGTLAVWPDASAGRTDVQGADAVSAWLRALSPNVELIDADATPASGSSVGTGAPVLGSGRETPPISLPLLIAACVVALAELAMGRYFSHARQVIDEAPADAGRAAA